MGPTPVSPTVSPRSSGPAERPSSLLKGQQRSPSVWDSLHEWALPACEAHEQCTGPSPQEEGHAGPGTEGWEQDCRLVTAWAGFAPRPCVSELCWLTGSGSERVARPPGGTERAPVNSQLGLPQGHLGCLRQATERQGGGLCHLLGTVGPKDPDLEGTSECSAGLKQEPRMRKARENCKKADSPFAAKVQLARRG